MMRRSSIAVVCLVALMVAHGAARAADDEASTVKRLLGEVRSSDFETAYAAAQQLREHPASRREIVPVLIDAITRGEWNRCAGDMRDAIAATLGELKARDAVTPLLDLVKSGKPIEHECVE